MAYNHSYENKTMTGSASQPRTMQSSQRNMTTRPTRGMQTGMPDRSEELMSFPGTRTLQGGSMSPTDGMTSFPGGLTTTPGSMRTAPGGMTTMPGGTMGTPLVPGMPSRVPGTETPTTVESPYYTAGFLRNFIGKNMRVEFLIGTSGTLVDRVGVLVEVGASYIVLRPSFTDDLLMCDLYTIKFVTIFA